MTSPFDPNWRPPSPRVSGGQIGIAVGIGVGLMIASYVTAGIAIATSYANRPAYSYPAYTGPIEPGIPLAPGDPGSAVAVSPLVCATVCFTEDSVDLMILPETSFVQLGLDAPDVRWRVDQHEGAIHAHSENIQSWENTSLSPDDCFPTWPVTPDATVVAGQPATDDPVGRIVRTTGPDGFSVTQTARVFADSTAAEGHMDALSTALYDCGDYFDFNGNAADLVLTEAALPDATLPESVAAVGLVRVQTDGSRDYVMDVQCGNVVIRSTAHSNDGTDQENLFRELMTAQASQMATVTPVS